MRRLKLVALVFVVVSVLAAGSVQAAPFSYTDDAGDALDGRASLDIVKVTHDLRQVNKAGPPSIVVEMELAAPPESVAVSYGVNMEIPGCGSFVAAYRPGAVVYEALGIASADFYVECSDEFLPATFRIEGNVLRWAIAIDGLQAKYRSGKLENLNAFTEIADPAMGETGTAEAGLLPVDAAATDQTWSY